jgi:ribosomal protein S18 acetylase RimI-like enzyme
MNYSIHELTINDYDEVYRLWEQTEGLNLEEDDSREAIDIYLRRNRGLCFVAYAEGQIVGTVLCGHEGRRGILRHLAVKQEYRDKGIARALINRCLSALAKDGIKKCNTFVLDKNVEGRLFWEHMGWHVLEDSHRTMQISIVQDK